MRLSELFQSRQFVLSIEIFPPKTDDGDSALHRHLERLVEYDPAFISCTYGAGGSTQAKTLAWCHRIQHDLQRTAMAHFTCVGATREELIAWLAQAAEAGVHNIMALRGDPPAGESEFRQVDGGLKNANELVSLIRECQPEFGIGVAGYPEKHVEAPSLEVDLQNLKRKVDAGADAVFTQLFFINDNFLSFRDRCDRLGISIPIVPGIMPITDFARIKRITSMCGTLFPDDLATRLEAVKDDAEAQFNVGVEYAIRQCEELRDAGVPGMHFYALNRSDACRQILDAIHVCPKSSPQ
ncbi:MAG: methylenetetrahydrofolate reductase [NAD(P)H] [Planctomycetaceae bacterium]|nr:methylenetetrahydrofolate reductase [NAD(P)H] [Planctomycetaceae bacterium]